jgi:hypothetical protein
LPSFHSRLGPPTRNDLLDFAAILVGVNHVFLTASQVKIVAMSSDTSRSTLAKSVRSKPPCSSAFHQASRKFAPPALAGILMRNVEQLFEGEADAIFHEQCLFWRWTGE